MKSQPIFGSKHTGRKSLVIFLVFLLLLIAAGNVNAKKPLPPEPAIVSDSLVRWGGNELLPGVLEANYRFCTFTEVADDLSSGTYTCELNGSRVFYDFANFTCEVAHKRGDDSRCSSEGSQYFIEPDLEYSFSWNGDCTSVEGCEISVVNRFTHVAILGGPVTRIRVDPLLDRVTLEGFGRVNNTTAVPFEMSQSVIIDYMHITFIGTKGKDKALAVCRATPLHEEYPVTFETTAVEQTE